MGPATGARRRPNPPRPSRALLPLLLPLLILAKPQDSLASQNQPDQPAGSAARQAASANKTQVLNVQEADENGLYLLGLFDLHQASPRAPLKCGPIELDAGEWRSRRPMQNMEAFLWAIEQVNADKSLLPGVKLGSLVLDTCSSFLRTNQQLANLLHGEGQPAQARQLAALVADQADWQSVEATASVASALGLTTFVSQSRSSRLIELARRYRAPAAAQLAEQLSHLSEPPAAGVSLDFGQELLRRSSANPARRLEGLLDELLGVGKLPASLGESVLNESVEERDRLLMVRMQLGSELVAEAIAALLQRMSWDLVSVVYDDEPDMVELHEELAKQLLARNMQLALDEQVSLSAPADAYDGLLGRLAAKSEIGARVAISLVSSGTARNLLAGLRRMRASKDQAQVRQVNALLWVSVADREPYYAFAVDALGTLVVSGASSLMPDFRAHYERLAGARRNKWWPEYLRGILLRQQRELELLANECARWQEPARSPLPERCAGLSLSALVQAERQAGNKTAGKQPGRLAKYLAGGWEHNGMEVINAVLAAANGLESVRQTLCPEGGPGLCPRMRELLARDPAAPLPSVSELMYNELLRSTFQLADGRMFNLDGLAAPVGQVEGRLKLYSLRYLQPNSIGFVRFGSYDQQDGLALNASKALHYPLGASPLQQEPIERLRSSCEDESKCLSADAMTGAKTAISEEELALGVNSLFKLDHPLILSKPGTGEQELAEEEEAQETYTMRSQLGHQFAANQSTKERISRHPFNVIVLLPLHLAAAANQQCAGQPMDTERAFQQLAALAFAQGVANQQSAQEEQQIELTTTVIDYCERQELAKSRLAWRLSEQVAAKSAGRTVALIDFDAEVSKNVGGLADQADLLHLTIGADSERPASGSEHQDSKHHHHLRVSLLPAKADEIQALVKLIAAMANWRLVHLVYTDKQHRQRDEFVRRANEANICVSKLIYIPAPSESGQQVRQQQLAKMRQLFLDELHDYGNATAGPAHAPAEGLNATRVLVVLASAQAGANLLLQEAATDSMLDDYVWLTTHEWLNSVERPAEAAQSPARLPRLLLSTRLESADAHEFGQYLEGLSPAAHSPLPTRWFDQFWQQHFRCRLPIARAAAQPAGPAPCKPHERLEARDLWQDERVHYTIRAVEALHVALSAHNGSQVPGHELASGFRLAFDRARQLEAPGSSLGRLPYGFHIVHRLLASEPPTSAPGRSVRRDNSRDLSASQPAGQLLRVGVWRAGELVLARQHQRATWIGAGEPSDADTAAAVSRSLAKLALVRSRCALEATCGLCRAQIGQTNALIRQEEARLRLSEAVEPSVVSSIRFGAATPPPSSLDSQPEAAFDEDTEGPPAGTSPVPRGPKDEAPEDLIQAAASSLIGQPSVEQRRLDDIRAAYGRLRQSGMASAAGQPPFNLNLRQTSGALMSGLSLVGVVGVVVSMAYLYPNASGKAAGETESERSASSSASGSLHQLDNINDYFLLTGLLMLYSINMAFLLPATTGVCWFRRVGLPASYSVILSALLVRALAACRRHPDQQQPAEQQPASQQQQAATDSSEESVEVTFESLPAEQPSDQPPANQLSNGYQTSGAPQPEGSSADLAGSMSHGLAKPATLLTLQIGLVLSQLLASLVWLARQPPEPTLYLGCWRCASPSRSPLLFLYEPLLSLLYPALMLLCAWLLSVHNFRSASRAERQFRLATRRLLSPCVCQNDWQLNAKRQHLKQRLRDAKALVMAATLLVLVWSLATLHMISSGGNKSPAAQQASGASHPHQQQAAVYSLSQSESVKGDDLSLVYANIVSGAVVFVFLFVYRLRLTARAAALRCPAQAVSHFFRSKTRNLVAGSSGSFSTASSAGTSGQQRVLKFNQSLEPPTNSKWLDECAYPSAYGSSSFSSSQFSAMRENQKQMDQSQRQERLRLQQFSSYGTYAATDATASRESLQTSATVNPLSFQAIASSFTSAKFNRKGSAARAAPNTDGSQETLSGKGSKKRSRGSPASLFFGSPSASKKAATGQLQRRQSAGSVASSTAQLVRGNNWMLEQDDLDDTISCASSVASSSTSQLHGNDLYPINCSIQLDMQLANPAGASTLARSGSFRRSSLRRSVSSKLGSVREEQRT